MARLPRNILPAHPHHITVRGNGRRALFSYPRDYRVFIEHLARALIYSPCEVHAATLMTNHVHLVVTPKDGMTLARFVKYLCQRHAQTINKRRKTTGCLFEERYACKPIVDETQLALTLAYVDLNPVRAGITDDVAAFRWSTYACHTGKKCEFPSLLWTPTAWYESLASTAEARALKYAEWVADCRSRDVRPEKVTRLDAREAALSLNHTSRPRRPDGKRGK